MKGFASGCEGREVPRDDEVTSNLAEKLLGQIDDLDRRHHGAAKDSGVLTKFNRNIRYA